MVDPGEQSAGERRGRPYDRLARDLRRAVARVWQELTGEYPPISDPRTAHEENLYQQLMKHTFGAAGLAHWEIHALEAAKEVRREREIELKRGATRISFDGAMTCCGLLASCANGACRKRAEKPAPSRPNYPP